MQRIAVFDTTDHATLIELAGNPEIELDITALSRHSCAELPDNIEAQLYAIGDRMVLPRALTCRNIIAPNAVYFFANKLRQAGVISVPCARHFIASNLWDAEEIDAHSAEFITTPRLKKCGLVIYRPEVPKFMQPYEPVGPRWMLEVSADLPAIPDA